ncbi:mitogen-activated protein kinase kinase kinase yoda [Quercus suber]|uniref:Mitogen-activated protein kinase kinase kinase yoda n=1 Tax=Quercus suber TaxID=58331 RepID=A0AAW0KC12_QUESU
MPSWWRKSSSKEVKKKANRESFIDSIHRKFKSASEEKCNSRSGGSCRRCSDTVSERGTRSRVPSRSPSPSTQVSRCQSFAERPHAQPLPLPGADPADAEADIATASFSSDSSTDSDDPSDSRFLSPLASDYENGNKTTMNSPSR